MKCREIIEILETLAPKSCACDWDNPGLLAGRIDKDVKKILLTLDADDAGGGSGEGDRGRYAVKPSSADL